MKRQITILMEESIIKEMEELRDDTGLSFANQINLRLNGYKVVKI